MNQQAQIKAQQQAQAQARAQIYAGHGKPILHNQIFANRVSPRSGDCGRWPTPPSRADLRGSTITTGATGSRTGAASTAW